MKRLVLSTEGVPEAERFFYWRAAVSDRLIGVGVERDKDRESRFSGRLIGFCGEEPDAFVSILLDGEK
jgi:hypothetical protein